MKKVVSNSILIDAPASRDGEKRHVDVYNKGEGWAPMLEEIRKVAEDRP